MTPSEFIRQWQQWNPEPDYRLITISQECAASLRIPTESAGFLIEAGLPNDAAPFLSFHELARGLPRVFESWGVSDDWTEEDRQRLNRYRTIGSDGEGNPICVDELDQGKIVLLDHEDFFLTTMSVNSGIPQLAAFLLFYRELVARTQEANGEDAFLDRNIPDELKKKVLENFAATDPDALNEGCFWWYEAQFV